MLRQSTPPSRLVFRAPFAITIVLLRFLVGCAASPDSWKNRNGTLSWEMLTEEEPFVLLRGSALGFDREVVLHDAENRVDTPSYTFRVSAIHRSETIPLAMLDYPELGGYKFGYERPEEGLQAPAGYEFIGADIVGNFHVWSPGNAEHTGEPSYQIKIAEEPLDAVVLEVQSEGVTQQLSLIDGSRTQSDIEQIYAANNTVQLQEADIYGNADDEYGGYDSLFASMGTANVFPFARPHGWAKADQIYLTVDVTIYQDFTAGGNRSASLQKFPLSSATEFRLELPDGSTTLTPQTWSSRSPTLSGLNS